MAVPDQAGGTYVRGGQRGLSETLVLLWHVVGVEPLTVDDDPLLAIATSIAGACCVLDPCEAAGAASV